ncbi:MAG: pyridoxal phosphate-dependent aminotransferase, partial [Methanosarcinaceae archaeon]
MPSSRLARVAESSTLRVANIANKLKTNGADIISFSVGEPDFDTPKHICDAAAKAMYSGETHYAPSAGVKPLREAIANKLRTENKLDVTDEDVLVTPGAKQAIFEIMMSVLDDGDEAIICDPAWVSYDPCVKFAGANTAWVPTDPENGFIPYNIAEHINERTRLIVVNSPCNPTGGVYGRELLKTIADLAIDHDLLVLSDEIYEKIIYGREHISIGSMDGMHDHTITVNGFSKGYAMTGWRLGYICAQEGLLQDFKKIHSHSVTSATTFAQYGAIAALEGPQGSVEAMVKEFRIRRDILIDGLNSLDIRCNKPDGAFYAFADISEYGSGDEIAEKLLSNAHVAVTPGSGFGESGKDFIRISYAASQDQIRQGLQR